MQTTRERLYTPDPKKYDVYVKPKPNYKHSLREIAKHIYLDGSANSCKYIHCKKKKTKYVIQTPTTKNEINQFYDVVSSVIPGFVNVRTKTYNISDISITYDYVPVIPQDLPVFKPAENREPVLLPCKNIHKPVLKTTDNWAEPEVRITDDIAVSEHIGVIIKPKIDVLTETPVDSIGKNSLYSKKLSRTFSKTVKTLSKNIGIKLDTNLAISKKKKKNSKFLSTIASEPEDHTFIGDLVDSLLDFIHVVDGSHEVLVTSMESTTLGADLAHCWYWIFE